MTESKATARQHYVFTGPTILVNAAVRYIRNGPMVVEACFVAPSPFAPGRLERNERVLSMPQPEPFTTDEDVLAAVRAKFPGAAVLWQADVEPET